MKSVQKKLSGRARMRRISRVCRSGSCFKNHDQVLPGFSHSSQLFVS